jgi:hypothetical protein
MKAGRVLLITAGCLLVSACYHQIVQTGRTPGATVVSRPWTPTWVFGLVAAKPIDVSKECPSGIATVETQMTFPNALATIFTLGIYDPRDVRVTCATRSALGHGLPQIDVARDATAEEREQAFTSAVELSERMHQPVVLRF